EQTSVTGQDVLWFSKFVALIADSYSRGLFFSSYFMVRMFLLVNGASNVLEIRQVAELFCVALKSMHVGSLAFAVEGQVKEKSKWFASLRDMVHEFIDLHTYVKSQGQKTAYVKKLMVTFPHVESIELQVTGRDMICLFLISDSSIMRVLKL
ncbi:hypothetical protein Tco_1270740, partial [Tanacetum coccineum]